MRKIRLILICLSALLLAGACTRLEEQTSLNIYIRLPEQTEEETKAVPGVDDWASLSDKEVRINDLRIWVFLNTSTDGSIAPGTLLGYLEPKQLNFTGGHVQKFTIALNRAIASKIQTADVYVLANAGAASLYNVGIGTTPAELDELVLSENLYGIFANGEPTNKTVVDNVGLPYTAVKKNVNMIGSGVELSVASVELVRAVSKVQFVFCQIQDNQGDKPVEFQILSLKLNANQIAEQEYLFNDSPKAYKIGTGYVARALTAADIPTKATIAGSTSPGGFAYSPSETAAEYQTRIDAALKAGAVTGCSPCYLRESDKALTGQIRYQIGNGGEKTLDFNMTDGEKFVRNSNWIVYFFFNNDSMSLSVAYVDWIKNEPYEL